MDATDSEASDGVVLRVLLDDRVAGDEGADEASVSWSASFFLARPRRVLGGIATGSASSLVSATFFLARPLVLAGGDAESSDILSWVTFFLALPL